MKLTYDWTGLNFGRVEKLVLAEPSRMDENKENLGIEESSPVAHKKGIKDTLDSWDFTLFVSESH